MDNTQLDALAYRAYAADMRVSGNPTQPRLDALPHSDQERYREIAGAVADAPAIMPVREAEIIKALRNLPISIQITNRGGGYMYQCMAQSGVGHTLPQVLSAALTYLIASLAGTRLEALSDKYELPEHLKE